MKKIITIFRIRLISCLRISGNGECVCVCLQGETKVLKLKNLRPQDFANYTCQVSVRNVCDIPDTSVTFRLTNATSELNISLVFFALNSMYQSETYTC